MITIFCCVWSLIENAGNPKKKTSIKRTTSVERVPLGSNCLQEHYKRASKNDDTNPIACISSLIGRDSYLIDGN